MNGVDYSSSIPRVRCVRGASSRIHRRVAVVFILLLRGERDRPAPLSAKRLSKASYKTL